MKNKQRNLWCYFLATVFMLALLFPLACQASDNDYKTMTVKNRIAHFSFEYRAYYHDIEGPRVVESATYRFTFVHIFSPQKERKVANPEPGSKGEGIDMSYTPAFMDVRAADASFYHSPASTRIENSLNSWTRWENFKLLERSPVVVAGIEAELIAYQIDSIFPTWPLEYHIEISFDYGGLQWDIEANTDLDMQEMLRSDVEHIIATFKIIE